MPSFQENSSHLAFLEPVHHYIKAIFLAQTPSAQAAAFANAQAYFRSCLQDNRAAAQQLRAERVRLLQECQVPVHYVRHCRLICGRHLPQQRPHQLVVQDINSAISTLELEEKLIVHWKAALTPIPQASSPALQHQQHLTSPSSVPISSLCQPAQPQVVYVSHSPSVIAQPVVPAHHAQ